MRSTEKKCKTFVESYETRFHESPSYYAALGYDNIGLMIEALEIVAFDSSKVKDGLYSIKAYQGVTGEISIDKNGDVYKPVILKKVINGHFTVVE